MIRIRMALNEGISHVLNPREKDNKIYGQFLGLNVGYIDKDK